MPNLPDYSLPVLNGLMMALLPHGIIWPREAGATLPTIVNAMLPTVARINARAATLLQEAPYGSLTELLPEWEAALGLPDPCAGIGPSITQRRRAVAAKLAARGGQSVPYFITIAAQLGIAVTIQEFSPFRAGMRVGQRVYAENWAHAWHVTTPNTTIELFHAGISRAGDRLATTGSRELACTFARIGPAQAALQMAYAR